MKQRILSRVDIVGECWIWNGAKKGSGLKSYGHLTVGSRTDGSRKTVSAHRFSYEVFIGEIPDGHCVCHTCDTPSCVNPSHLFIGTIQDNVNDREFKGRNTIPALSGEGHPFSLLNWDAVNYIRSVKINRGDISMLARKYKVNRKTVADVLSGRTWKNNNNQPPEEE